jgi:UDP-N-acetylmuramate dehydrogenase
MIVDKESAVPNSLAIPSVASFVANIKSEAEIAKIDDFAKKEGLPLFVIGEGTNIIPRNYINGVVAVLDFKGIKETQGQLKVSAGENWDNVVDYAVNQNLTGIEALSFIPGKTGSAPIQNIGAYGSEISDCLESVEVYDRTKKEFIVFNKKECQFGYRSSLFKKYPDNFIVISIILKLSKEKPKIPKYKDVEEYFREKNNNAPRLKEIRKAIIKIRKNKLPDLNIIPNVGSYFTNPILEEKKALAIKNKFPEIPLFLFENGIKIPAGWLIEKVGLKGAKIGKMEISANNALVLTNPNKASFEEIMKAEDFIIQKVFQKFGIILEREPRII